MWRIFLGDETLHDPAIGVHVVRPVLSQQLNAADQLVFDITPDHALYSRVTAGVLTERVTVLRDGNPVSYGRVLSVERRPLDAYCTVTVEGELAELADAVKAEYDFSGTPAQLLKLFLDEHRAQCGGGFLPGRVTVQDSNDYIVRGSVSPVPLLGELLSKTVASSTGGVLQVRHEGTSRYIDWLAEPEASGSQAISKGSNLLRLAATTDGASLVTAIMPLGAELEDGTRVRMPAGKDKRVSGDVYRKGQYLYNKPLVDRYGWHAQVREWTDVTIPSNLRSKAAIAVAGLSMAQTIEIGAVDLTDAGYDADAIAIGQRVNVECDDIAETVFVTGCEFHLDQPAASIYTFGKLAGITDVAAIADGAGWSEGALYAKKLTIDGDIVAAGDIAAGGDITATGNVEAANIGAYLGFETSAAVSVPSGTTVTNVLSFELPAGTWVVFGGVYFSANATGRRLACIGDTATHQSGTVIRRSGFAVPAAPAGVTCGKIGNIYVNNAATTRYVNVMHGAGVALDVTASIRAVRIR